MTEPLNHWSWMLDDPDIEYQEHVDGVYGAFRFVRKSTGETVGWGQADYPASYFEQSMTPEELAEWRRPPDPNLVAILVRKKLQAP